MWLISQLTIIFLTFFLFFKMATIRSMLGTIEGSAGGLTFASRGGKNVVRQKVGKNNSKTPKQQAVRSRFSELGSLAKAIGGLLLIGYKKQGGQTGYNRFMGANYDTTSVDSDMVASIDFSKIEISSGGIAPLTGLALADTATGKTVSWTNNTDGNAALASDKVYVALVRTETNQVAESLGTKTRADGSVDVPAPYLVGVANGTLALLAFAGRADGSDVSPTSRVAVGNTPSGPAASYSTTLTGPNDDEQGVTLAASAGDLFKFNALATGGSAPANMDVAIGGNQVASVAYLDRYNGKPFSFTHAGVTYTGAFANTVSF
jgi:hypothetical protein